MMEALGPVLVAFVGVSVLSLPVASAQIGPSYTPTRTCEDLFEPIAIILGEPLYRYESIVSEWKNFVEWASRMEAEGESAMVSANLDRIDKILRERAYLQECGLNPERLYYMPESVWRAFEIAYPMLEENGYDTPPVNRMAPYSNTLVTGLSDGTPVLRWALTDSDGDMLRPLDVTADSENVFVLGDDNLFWHVRDDYELQKFSRNGTFEDQNRLALSSGNGDYISIDEITVSPNGELYFSAFLPSCIAYNLLSDDYNYCNFGGNNIGTVIVAQGGFSNIHNSAMLQPITSETDAPDPVAQFKEISDITVDHEGNVYVAEAGSPDLIADPDTQMYVVSDSTRNSKVVKLTSYSVDSVISTNGTSPGEVFIPMGVAADNQGNIYVADAGNSRIQKLTDDGAYVIGWGAGGTGSGQFTNLVDVAVDSDGIVYALDYNVGKCGDALPDHREGNCYFSRIQMFTSGGTFIGEWDTGKMGDYYKPLKLSSGSLYVLFENNPNLFIINPDEASGSGSASASTSPVSQSGTGSQSSGPSQSVPSGSTQNTESLGSQPTGSQDSASSTANGGGCLIATAAYGSEFAPQVQMLREIRDGQLLKTSSGSSFMSAFNSFYYSWSPTVAEWERQNPAFRESVRIAITPLISTLSILTHVSMDTEAEALGYGIGIILMNIGIYFVAPAFAVMFASRKLKGWGAKEDSG